MNAPKQPPGRSPGSIKSAASNPGRVILSHTQITSLQPQLRNDPEGTYDRFLKEIGYALYNGDARAAVVIDAEAGLVAAYTDELDCVVLLHFHPTLVAILGWRQGTRLLTVNMYALREHGVAADLVPGPADTGVYGNYRPLIATLLTDDPASLIEPSNNIEEAEWQHAFALGWQLRQSRQIAPRDGRPLTCGTPLPLRTDGRTVIEWLEAQRR